MKKDSINPRATPLDAVIGADIKRRRTEKEMSQDELADKLGISKTLLFFLEKGERAWNSTTISAALDFFGITLADLVGGTVLSDQDRTDLELIRAHRNASQKIEAIKGKLTPSKRKPKR
jgi:transcriptional regulator with XRE-family HTH domain